MSIYLGTCQVVSALLLPLNLSDYSSEGKHGYHPIEFLFKNKDLIGFKQDAIVKEDGNQRVEETYFVEPDRSVNAVRLNLTQEEKMNFAEHIKSKKDEIDFQNFESLLKEMKKLFGL